MIPTSHLDRSYVADVRHTAYRCWGVFLLGALAAGAGHADGATPSPTFRAGSVVEAPEGHATLQWTVEPSDRVPGTTFQLQQASTPAFDDAFVRYVGPEDSLFVSGLEDGDSWFRVRMMPPAGTPGPWSEPTVVEVRYPSRGRVLLLLGAGCVVFVGTVLAIVVGWSRDRGDRDDA